MTDSTDPSRSLLAPRPSERASYDSPWKEAIEAFFLEALHLLFPEVHDRIEPTAPIEFLDKELAALAREGEHGGLLVDKLARVRARGGGSMVVLLHIKVQAQPDAVFARRMFLYYARLRDRFDLPVVSLAILADEHATWRPDRYREGLWGCSVELRFPTAKLLDWQGREAALRAHPSPIACFVEAHLRALETRKDPLARLHYKREVIRALFERGLDKEQARKLFRFIDWIMALPPALEQRFYRELHEERGNAMAYVTGFERIAMQKGLQKGLEQGRVLVLLQQLARRFGPLTSEVEARVRAAPSATLDVYADRILDARTLAEVLDDPPTEPPPAST